VIRADRSLKERVYQSIREAIIDGELVPGSLYSVQTLADVFEVSRTPVREALIDLAAQGMVRFERNRGVRILETSIHDLEEILTLRLLLEVPATYRATQQINDATIRALEKELRAMGRAAEDGAEREVRQRDRRFHEILLEMSGNRRLTQYVDHLRDLIMVRGYSTVGPDRSLETIVEEHREILARIQAKDPKGAATAMQEHVSRTGKLLLTQEGGRRGTAALPWASILRLP
jgi:DNA-binding GntR family transcriptional regulator